MRTISGHAYIDGHFVPATIAMEGAKITRVDRTSREVDDRLIMPGFIDLHVHGAAGFDFMDATDEAMAKITSFHARNGTTALAATTLSGSTEAIGSAVSAIARAEMRERSAEIVGIHLEGPYVNAKKAGAQDRRSIRKPDRAELKSWLDLAPEQHWMMTIAPEIDGAMALIREFNEWVVFSIGHTEASYEQTCEAVQAGAQHFTHLFNAMPPLHHRDPGPIAAASDPKTTAELIADGQHVHPAVLRIAAHALDGRVTLVTDAMRGCGMPDGVYKLYEHEVTVSNGAARLKDGTLAGSVLTMFDALRNMVTLAHVPLHEAVAFATEVPARTIGVSHRKGRVAPGLDADLVIATPALELQSVFVRGEEIRIA